VIRSWLDECDHRHAEPECGPTASALQDFDAPVLPSRVIDLGLVHPARPYLLETKGLRGHYIALTHRWGGFNGVLTSKETLARFETGLPVERIPRTFQDVIRLARDLGLRYLWIDILCIVQDDDDEWVREAAAFGVIFDNAYLTVAAASASDASSGTFLPRSPENQFVSLSPISDQETLFISEYSPFSFDALADLQIYQRAWVMQELLLSRRILHVGVDQVYWQCDHLFEAENGEVRSGPTLRSLVSPFWKRQEVDEVYHQNLCLVWSSLVKAYSKCFISFAEDKLPGLFKIANKILEANDLTYDQGHWLQPWSHSACSLMWFAANGALKRPAHERRPARTILPTQKVVPSWSWASLDGPLDFLLHHQMDAQNWTHGEFEPNAGTVQLQEPYVIGQMLHTPLALRASTVSLSGVVIQALGSASRGPTWPDPPTRGRALTSQDNAVVGWLCSDLDEPLQELFAIRMFTSKALGPSLVLIVQSAGDGFPVGFYTRFGVGLLDPALFNIKQSPQMLLTLV
jgi:hypothetical protein